MSEVHLGAQKQVDGHACEPCAECQTEAGAVPPHDTGLGSRAFEIDADGGAKFRWVGHVDQCPCRRQVDEMHTSLAGVAAQRRRLERLVPVRDAMIVGTRDWWAGPSTRKWH